MAAQVSIWSCSLHRLSENGHKICRLESSYVAAAANSASYLDIYRLARFDIRIYAHCDCAVPGFRSLTLLSSLTIARTYQNAQWIRETGQLPSRNERLSALFGYVSVWKITVPFDSEDGTLI